MFRPPKVKNKLVRFASKLKVSISEAFLCFYFKIEDMTKLLPQVAQEPELNLYCNVYCLHYRGLCCTLKCLHQKGLSCTWTGGAEITETWAAHGRDYTQGLELHLDVSTLQRAEATAASGLVYATGAWAAPYLIWTTEVCAAPGLIYSKICTTAPIYNV